jgi:hypothetical protein
MSYKPNRKPLRLLMVEHDLEAKDVARIIGRKEQTVAVYCSKTLTDIPDELLKVLEEHCTNEDEI